MFALRELKHIVADVKLLHIAPESAKLNTGKFTERDATKDISYIVVSGLIRNSFKSCPWDVVLIVWMKEM